MKIIYIGSLTSTCGYGQASRYYLEALESDPEIEVFPLDILDIRNGKTLKYNGEKILIHFNPSVNTSPIRRALAITKETLKENATLLTVWEYDDLPTDWITSIARFNTIIVPSSFSAISFKKYHQNVHVIPHYVTTPSPYGHNIHNENELKKDTFKLLSICSRASDRKGIDLLLEAFGPLAKIHKDMRLTIKLYLANAIDVDYLKSIQKIYAGTFPLGSVKFDTHCYSDYQMARLIYTHDAHILLSRGEGFGLIYAETALAGRPNIYPVIGGQSDFMAPHLTGFGVECRRDKQLTYNVCYSDTGMMYIPMIESAQAAIMRLYKIWKFDKKNWFELCNSSQRHVSRLLSKESICKKFKEVLGGDK